MATVSAMQDKAVQKTLESSVKAWSNVDAIQRTNGLNKNCHFTGEPQCFDDNKRMKISGVASRLNGQHASSSVNKMRFPVLLCPPTLGLRSRPEDNILAKVVSSKRERRSNRIGKHDNAVTRSPRINGKQGTMLGHNNNHGESKLLDINHRFNGNHKKLHVEDTPTQKFKCSQSPSQDSNCKVFHNNQHSETKMALEADIDEDNFSDSKTYSTTTVKCNQHAVNCVSFSTDSLGDCPNPKPPTADMGAISTSYSSNSYLSVSSGSSMAGSNCRDVTRQSVSSNPASVNFDGSTLSSECSYSVFNVPSPVTSVRCTSPKLSHSHPLSRTSVDVSISTGTVTFEQKSEADGLVCRWLNCGATSSALLLKDHLTSVHVDVQTSGPYACKWEGCKVYGKASCNKSWLERHILTHSGDKPFCCIVDGCGLRFTSQYMLERHVNAHFKADLSGQASKTRGRDDTPSKASKKRKSRKKRPWQVKKTDYIDSWCVERMRHSVLHMQRASLFSDQDSCTADQPSLSFHSSVIGRRLDESDHPQVLLHWHPDHILPDQWLDESQVAQFASCSVPLSLLPPDFSPSNDPGSSSTPYPFYQQHRFRKHRRK